MKRVGIYSGTFDPVHIGHVGFARRAAEVAGLDEVVFLPERSPRDKINVTSVEHRFAMVECAIEHFSNLTIRLLDQERFSTSSTMPFLHHMFGGAELSLLIGSDVVETSLPYWEEVAELLVVTSLVVGLRDGANVGSIEKVLRGLGASYEIIESPMPAISATNIRRSLDAHDVHPRAVEYIEQHNLYGLKGGLNA